MEHEEILSWAGIETTAEATRFVTVSLTDQNDCLERVTCSNCMVFHFRDDSYP